MNSITHTLCNCNNLRPSAPCQNHRFRANIFVRSPQNAVIRTFFALLRSRFYILYFRKKIPRRRGAAGGDFHGGAVGRRRPRRPGPSALLLLLKIIHCADKAGVVLEGCSPDLKALGEGGHDAFAHLRGQRVYQKRLLRADAAADQDQLRVEDVYKARKALGDLVDPAVEHSQRAGVACGGSLKDRTPVGASSPAFWALRTSAVVAA